MSRSAALGRSVWAGVLLVAGVLTAQSARAESILCSFQGPFEALRTQVGPAIVGECLADEEVTARGDVIQRTTRGILARDRTDGRVAFSDGKKSWLLGPDGISTHTSAGRAPAPVPEWRSAPIVPIQIVSQSDTAPVVAASISTTAAPPVAAVVPPAAAPPPVAAAPALPARPTVVSSAALATRMPIGGGRDLGGLSGLVSLDRSGASFLAVTDRGPTRDVKVGGDKAAAFSSPMFAPSVVRLRLDNGQLALAERIPLKLGQGTDSVTGQAVVSGLPTSGRDEPAYDEAARRALGIDPNGVDPEGIALDPRDGSFWVSEEYGPSILHVAPDGTILSRLVPDGLALPGVGYEVRPVLPGALLARKRNRGFEGIALSPDGRTLFAIMQSPLSLPDKRAGEASRNVRLVTLDVSGEPRLLATYLYQAERFNAVGVAEQDDVKVGDLAALGASRLLVVERDDHGSAAHRKVYLIDLAAASDVTTVPGGRPLEQLSDDDLWAASLRPVAKTQVADLLTLGYSHELVEGLAIVDDTTIAVVNDNDFQPGESSELLLVRLPAPLR